MSKFYVQMYRKGYKYLLIDDPFDTIEEAWKHFFYVKRYYRRIYPDILKGLVIQIVQSEILGEEEL